MAWLSFLLLIVIVSDLGNPMSWRPITQVDAATPHVTSKGNKYERYTQRLQTLLDQRPLLERQWRTYRSYPYFDRAARLVRSQDIDGALAEYTKYLANDPDHFVMRWQQLLTLSQTSQLEETVSVASALLQRLPDFGPALLIRAVTLRKLDRTEEAERDLLAARKDRNLMAGDHLFLLSELYTLALNRKDFATALAFLEAQQVHHPDPTEWHKSRAVLLEHQGRLKEAEQAWQRVIDVTTDHHKQRQATLSRTRILDKLEQYATALDSLVRSRRQGAFAPPGIPKKELEELHSLTAEVAQKAGQIDTAIEAFDRLMSLAPSPETRLKLANLLFLKGNADRAIQLLQPLQSMPLTAANADERYTWYNTLGNIAFESGQLSIAFKAYRQALSVRDTPDDRLRASEVAWQLKRYSDVVDLLQPVAKTAKNRQPQPTLPWRQRLCSAYTKQEQYNKALQCAEALVEAHPDNPDVLIEAVHLALQAEQPLRQLEHLRRFYRLKPMPELALNIGYLLTRLDLDAEAGDWFRRAYQNDKSAAAGLTYAQFLLKYHERDMAIEVLHDILKRPDGLSSAEQSTAYAALGYALADARDFSGAAAVWRQAYDVSADPALKLRQIWALRQAGHVAQAQAELDAFSLDTLPAEKEVSWYEEVGMLLHQMGDFEGSLEVQRKALKLKPTAQNWVQLSDTLMALNQPSEADMALVEALKLRPNTPAYLKRLAYVYITLQRDRDAAALFEQVRVSGEADVALDGDLGYLYTRLADNDNAVAAFKRAIDHEPHYLTEALEARDDVKVKIARMRRQVNTMERQWLFSLTNNTCLVDDGCRIGTIAADDSVTGLAFGSLAVAYQPPKIGFRNGKIFQLFGRLLWSYEPNAFSFEVNEDSLQAGLGARYKPLVRHNLFVSIEHLFKIGDDADNNWLARVSWSHTQGADWRPQLRGDATATGSVPYLNLYADISKFFQHDQELVLTGAAHYGRAFQSGRQWLFSPFAYGVGQATIDHGTDSQVEAGLGLSVRFQFDFNQYWGYRRQIEVFSRIGHDLHNSGSDLELRALAGVKLDF